MDQYKLQQTVTDYFHVDLPKTQHQHSLPTKFRYKMWTNGRTWPTQYKLTASIIWGGKKRTKITYVF